MRNAESAVLLMLGTTRMRGPALRQRLKNTGFEEVDVLRAMQRLLDAGKITVGPFDVKWSVLS